MMAAVEARERLLLAAMVGVLFLLFFGWWLPRWGRLSFGKWNGIGEPATRMVKTSFDLSVFGPPYATTSFGCSSLCLADGLRVLLAVILTARCGAAIKRFSPPVVSGVGRIHLATLLLRDQGLINDIFHGQVDWYGDPNVNIGRYCRHGLAAYRLRDAVVFGRPQRWTITA
jgi:multiple sugar transport system permease protein